MSNSIRARDYLFDNYKALLIILVVIGHFTQPCYENNTFLYILKYFIYAFHMPAFIFISGYFSRREVPFTKIVQKILVPYLAFESIYFFYYADVIHVNNELPFLKPKFSLWYLLALFAWKAVTPYFKKIPHYFLLSIIMGLAIGLVGWNGEILSFARIFAFYPYFLAGTLLDRARLDRFRCASYRICSLTGILWFVFFLVAFAKSPNFRLSFFYGKTGYAEMGQTPLEGIFVRLLCYGIGFFLTYAFAILMTDKETIFSKLGTVTMPIYLFHGLLFKFLEECTAVLRHVNTLPETFLFLTFCVALAFILSWKPLCKFTNYFSSVSLETFFQRLEISDYYLLSDSNYWVVALLDTY